MSSSGDGRTGAALVGLVDVVCFTGSVKTGRTVGRSAAEHFIPAFLELGGKDPVIVTETADLELATDVVLRASVLATGQACQSLERVYVQDSLYDRFVARLVEKASAVPINYPDMHAGVVGPLIFDRQADIIAGQLDDAVTARRAQSSAAGVVEIHGGGGRWIRPTVVVDVDHSMQLMTEETFGPVMPVMRFHTVDEAVELANVGDYRTLGRGDRRNSRGSRGDRPAHRRGCRQPERRIADRRDARGREEFVQVLRTRRLAHGCGRA